MSDKRKLAFAGIITAGLFAGTCFFLRTPAAPGSPIHFMPLAASSYTGYIPAALEVNESGSPAYQVGIDVPPGTNDVTPAVNIVYSDVRKNGIMGMGWNLSGTSVITRTGQIIPQDSLRSGINFSNADRFTLNGQRLIAYRGANGKLLTTVAARNAANGQNGTEYRTEIESWSRIFSYGSAGTGPAYFLVYSKDGTVMQFGNTPDSRIQPPGAPAASSWAMNHIRDRNGNYVVIKYTASSQLGEALPGSISYTGNAQGNLLPQRMVKFNYAPRTDTIIHYYNGVKLLTAELLSSIQTYVDQDGDGTNISTNSNLVKKYSFHYSNSATTGRSLLDSLVLSDAAGSALPATYFSWTSYDIQNAFTDTLTPIPANFQRILLGPTESVRADFNGDGLLDIALLEEESDSVLIASVTNPCRLKTFNWAIPSGFYRYMNAPNSQTLTGDYNGDGLTDIAFYQQNMAQLPVMLTLPGGGFTGKMFTIPSNVLPLFNGRPRLITADFNGDGLTDISAFQSGARTMPVLLTTSALTFRGIYVTIPANVAPYINAAGAKQQTGDYNGDGLADIAVFIPNAQSIPVMFSSGTGNFTATLLQLPANVRAAVNATGANQVEGDYNGDGLADFAVFVTGYTSVPVIYSRGDGSFTSALVPLPASSGFNNAGVQQVAADVNGDGVTDLTAYGNGYKTIPTLLSSGGGRFTFIAQPLSDAVGQYLNAAGAERFVADFNGDGMIDVSALQTGFTQLPVLVVNNIRNKNNVPDMMTGTRDGIGAVTTIEYRPIIDTSVYTGSKLAYPYPLLSTTFPYYVVSHMRIADSKNAATTVIEYNYHYAAAIIDQHRGWQGFSKTYTADLQNNTMVTSTHWCAFPYSGITTEERVADLDDTTKLMEVVNFNYQSATEQGTGISCIWNSQLINSHYTRGNLNYTHYQNFEFDPQHRFILRIAEIKDDSGSEVTYTKFKYQPAPAADSLWWHAFYPHQQKISSDSSLSAAWSSWNAPDFSWTKFEYDSRMNITKNQSYMDNDGAGKASWVGTSVYHDAFGNEIISKTPPNYSADSITTQTVFDSIFHTFPVKNSSPDPLPGRNNPSLISFTKYDPRFGSIISATDVSGSIISNIPDLGMDGFGRVLIAQSVSPHSSALATRFIYSYGGNGNGYTITSKQPSAWTSSLNADNSWLTQTSFYDGFGRNYKTSGNGYAKNVELIQSEGYNRKGQLANNFVDYYWSSQHGIQYQPGGPALKNPLAYKQVYDKHGILSELRSPDPLNPDSMFLAERIVYDTNDNRICYIWNPSPANDAVLVYWKKQYNSSGDLEMKAGPYHADGSKGDNFCEMFYTYDQLERLILITDPLGEKIITHYNSLGSILLTHRPETDTVKYIYNTNSWLIASNDASGQLRFTYDDLGRPLTKTQQPASGAVQTIAQYIYDTDSIAPNSLGELSRAILKQGTYTFGYDRTGALTSQTIYLDSLQKKFTQHYSIDPLGRIDSIIYPDSSVANYTFDRMGNAHRTFLDGDTLMQFGDYTSSGSPLNSIAKNKVTSSFTYDNLGRELTSVTAKAAFTMRSYGYTWTKANKLITILDQRVIKDSSLTQQLTYNASGRLATASGPYGNQSFTYDAAGNRIADQNYVYHYDPVKKHQLVSITQSGKQLFNFTYTATGQLQTKTISQAFVKKDFPDVTADVKVNYTFDVQGNLDLVQGSVGGQEFKTVDKFTYDDSGTRVCKHDSDNTVTWYVSPFFEVAKVRSGELVCTKYIYNSDGGMLYASSAQPGPAERRRVALANGVRDKKETASPWSPFFRKNGGWAVNLPVYAAYILFFFFLFYIVQKIRALQKTKGTSHNRPSSFFGNAVIHTSLKWKTLFFAALIMIAQPAAATPVPGRNGPGVPVAGDERFFSHDHLGSTVLLTDANGGLTNSIEYQPFGSIDDNHSTGEDNFRQKYTGKEYDAYAGLFYFGARYYDGDVGRFISPDAAEQFPSPYAYGDGDPMSGLDPDGNEFAFIIALIVVAIVGAYAGAAIANGSFNPADWEWNSAKTWVGMIVGAAAGVAIVATGGAALSASGLVAAESVALGSVSANTLAFTAMDVAFLASDSYSFSTDPSEENAIFVAIDLIPFAAALGKTMKSAYRARKGAQAGEKSLERIPSSRKNENALAHTLCPFSFAEGTLVLTPGGEKSIEEIEVGDQVIAADETKGEKGTYAVSRIFQRVAVGLALLITSTGDTLAVTPEHPIYTLEAGWIEVKEVLPGDHLYSVKSFQPHYFSAIHQQEEKISVKSITITPDTVVTVYNFEVEKVHTYFVTSSWLFVHNPAKCGKAGIGGRHGDTSKFSEKKLFESNHFPASASYKGTPYEGISFRNKPAVTMHYKHHRAARTTGSSIRSKKWRAKQNNLLNMYKFADAMKMDIIDMTSITKTAVMKSGIKQGLIYASKYKHNGKPLISKAELTDLLELTK